MKALLILAWASVIFQAANIVWYTSTDSPGWGWQLLNVSSLLFVIWCAQSVNRSYRNVQRLNAEIAEIGRGLDRRRGWSR